MGKALNSESMITSGMNEVLTLYTGAVRGKEDSDLKHTPLLTTGDQSGLIPLSTLVDISRGRKQLNQALSPESQVPYLSVAVAIEGKSGSATSATATSTTPDEQETVLKLIRPNPSARQRIYGPSTLQTLT